MIRNRHILLLIRIGFIRDFLDHVVEESGAEYMDIMRKNEEGEFEELVDLENALDYPEMRQEIASRAVYYEVNALIESELYEVARRPWLESDRYPGPKTVPELRSLEDIRSLRIIQDVRFGQLVKLIEEGYNIKLSDLEGWEVLSQIREAVNAFKHRQGLVDFRRKQHGVIRIGKRHRAEVEKAYQILDLAHVFIRALWNATDQKPVAQEEEGSTHETLSSSTR